MYIDNALLTSLVTATRDNDTATLRETMRALIKVTVAHGNDADLDTAIALTRELDLGAPAAGEQEQEQEQEQEDRIYLGDVLESYGEPRSQASALGRVVKQAYIEKHGTAPETEDTELENGHTVPVAVYRAADADMIDTETRKFLRMRGRYDLR